MEAGQPPQPARAAEPVAITHTPEPADAIAPATVGVAEPAPAAVADSTDEMWVELPAVAEPAAKPASARRSRAKPKAAEDVVAVIEAEAAPALVEAEAEPAPVEVEAAPDHAEISSPPAAPKRGWWRRSG
jgi:ribonuclease E